MNYNQYHLNKIKLIWILWRNNELTYFKKKEELSNCILTWLRLQKENVKEISKIALPFRWEGVEDIELGIGERSSSILLKLWRTMGVAERIGGWNDIVLNIGELRNGVYGNQSGL